MTPIPSEHSLPSAPENEAQLDDYLTQPQPELVKFIPGVRGPLLILGAGGKMGPTLAVLARRAASVAGCQLRVVAVSRFSNPTTRQWLENRGVETVPCDLLNQEEIAQLPDSTEVLYLVGMKFGTGQNPARTWAANTIIPTNVARRYPRARFVTLSTGNVYPFVPVTQGGATEEHPLTPMGEYANAAVARERLFEFHSQLHGTPSVLVRLNYACELRYGVLHDLARKVWAGEPVDLANGHFNCIWQGDANDRIVRCLALAASPPLPLNLSGPETLSVRTVATELAERMGRSVKFTGTESDSALLSNSTRSCQLFGPPPTPFRTALKWTAGWIMGGGSSFNKPTHFEVRDGRY